MKLLFENWRQYLNESQFQNYIQNIENQLGMEVRSEADDWSVRITVHREDKEVGYFRASVLSGWDLENMDPACQKDWEKSGRSGIWLIRGAEWFDKDLKGRGFGKLLYRALFSHISSKDGAVAPHSCGWKGTTSSEARRVWDSLRKDYKNHGLVITP